MEYQLILLIIAALFVVGLFAWLALKPKNKVWKSKVTQNLIDLEKKINSNDPLQMRSAVVDADKLLDYVLKSRGARGETMGERLKSSSRRFERNLLNQVWDAHRLRNQIVHEINFEPPSDQLKKAFSALRRGIASLS